MAVIGSLTGVFTSPKRRPKAYKAKDAPYMVGGNRGFYIASLPRPYPLTPQQKKVKEVAKACGIKKGMSKADLMKAMVDCVGPKMRS
jgi:hypothetical protein